MHSEAFCERWKYLASDRAFNGSTIPHENPELPTRRCPNGTTSQNNASGNAEGSEKKSCRGDYHSAGVNNWIQSGKSQSQGGAGGGRGDGNENNKKPLPQDKVVEEQRAQSSEEEEETENKDERTMHATRDRASGNKSTDNRLNASASVQNLIDNHKPTVENPTFSALLRTNGQSAQQPQDVASGGSGREPVESRFNTNAEIYDSAGKAFHEAQSNPTRNPIPQEDLQMAIERIRNYPSPTMEPSSEPFRVEEQATHQEQNAEKTLEREESEGPQTAPPEDCVHSRIKINESQRDLRMVAEQTRHFTHSSPEEAESISLRDERSPTPRHQEIAETTDQEPSTSGVTRYIGRTAQKERTSIRTALQTTRDWAQGQSDEIRRMERELALQDSDQNNFGSSERELWRNSHTAKLKRPTKRQVLQTAVWSASPGKRSRARSQSFISLCQPADQLEHTPRESVDVQPAPIYFPTAETNNGTEAAAETPRTVIRTPTQDFVSSRTSEPVSRPRHVQQELHVEDIPPGFYDSDEICIRCHNHVGTEHNCHALIPDTIQKATGDFSQRAFI